MTNIRFAMKEDALFLPEIERSSGEAFRQIPHLAWIADDDVQSAERHEDLIRQGSAWVAEAEAGTIVGFLNAERFGHSLHIWQMAVHADYQQKGIGGQLVEASKQWSLGENLASITLTTFRNVAWNELFYRKCGFHLIDSNVPASLQGILDAEVAAGLPRDERCAMIYEGQ
jgi:GNAT superfamily N-acetyltransferase